jgi:hypothetical protein
MDAEDKNNEPQEPRWRRWAGSNRDIATTVISIFVAVNVGSWLLQAGRGWRVFTFVVLAVVLVVMFVVTIRDMRRGR